MSRKTGPNIHDVARAAQVSTATVSRAFRNPSMVNPETHTKVLSAARELGYSQREIQHAAPQAGTKTVSVIVPDVLDPFFCMLLKGIGDGAAIHEWSIVLCDAENSIEREMDFIDRSRKNNASGLILVTSGLEPEQVEGFDVEAFPLILLDRLIDLNDVNFVISDDRDGSYHAVKYLIDLGHRDIMFVGGEKNLSTERDRLEGYKKALDEHGLPLKKEFIHECSFNSRSAYDQMRSIIDKPHSPFSAVFAANDLIAYGIKRALEEKNLLIPEDISIIGYGNMPTSDYLLLTSVSSPAYEMGRNAMTMLVDLVAGRSRAPQQRVLRPTLVLRSSCSMKNPNR